MPTKQEVRRAIQTFRSTFSDVENITPVSFLDRKGINQPAEIYKNSRPPNIWHRGVCVVVSMSNINEAFDKGSKFSTN